MFNIKSEITKDFDIKIYLRPKITTLGDIIVKIIPPVIKNHDIITTPFIQTELTDIKRTSKGDSTTDLLVTEPNNNDDYIYRKFNNRDFQYEYEIQSPITIDADLKPISEQNTPKENLYRVVYLINVEEPVNINDSSYNGMYLVNYDNKENKDISKLQNFTTFPDYENIISFGSVTSIDFDNLPSNTISVLVFYLYSEQGQNWYFYLDCTDSAEFEIDNNTILSYIGHKNKDNTDYNISSSITLNEGYHKCILRFYNKNEDNKMKLYYQIDSSGINILSIENLPDKLLYTIPKLEQISQSEFNLDGFHIIPKLNNVQNIICKYNYIDDLVNGLEKNFVYNKLNDYTIDVDSVFVNDNINKDFLNDNISYPIKGWASNTDSSGKPTIIINFNNPYNNISFIKLYEFSDNNLCGGFINDLYRSSVLKIDIEIEGGLIRYISEFDIDIEKSINIDKIIDGNIIKKNRNGETLIHFTKQFLNITVNKIRIFKEVQDEEYYKWGLVTEVEIYQKKGEIPFKLITTNGEKTNITKYKKIKPIDIEKIPINIEGIKQLQKYEYFYIQAGFEYIEDNNKKFYRIML